MAIEREKLVYICYSDIAGQVRGKGFPARDLEKRRRFGVGWTPTNIMINCLGRIPKTPFGPLGDLHLVPVDSQDVVLDFGDGTPVEHWLLGEVRTLDGVDWECCLRSLLRRALTELENEMGLRILASFEHEFYLEGAEERSGDAYTLNTPRSNADSSGEFMAALRANGLAPETYLPEYGTKQYEVTVDPAPALEAADRAVKLREICRAVARRHGFRASFSPLVTRGVAGNGVHVHYSLLDKEDRPVTWDPQQPGELSEAGGSFAAGILRHIRALCALTAPSVISYDRLKPNSWSAFWGNLGLRDREALLRICPYPQAADVDPAPCYNLEYRASDAAASPYLQLAALVFAGLQGLREKLPAPPITEGDPEALGPEKRQEMGILDLPRSLGEALDALESDQTVLSWLGPTLSQAYLLHKRGELEMLADKDEAEICRVYTEAY